ncbi:MAG: hypothetical protein HY655_14050 [Acidobacteria bacterium]|nr:hypothetical protein [Acidobacteriota bacterium]
MRSLISTLAFGGGVAAIIVLLGARDLESYEHAFFSLDRGTAVEAVRVLGLPVHTLAVGLGVRLPLHGSLGASPAARLASYLPAPLTYWLLLALSITAAVFIIRHALAPLCDRGVVWLAAVVLFCSVPVVAYTIYADWPEVAVTYSASVGCVFAPHALLALLGAAGPASARRLAGYSLAGIVWGLVAVSHPGYWPLVAAALVSGSLLALCRSEYAVRTRLAVVVTLGAVSLLAAALQASDIARELAAAGDVSTMRRFVDQTKSDLMTANRFPFAPLDSRAPFSLLPLALVSGLIGFTSRHAHARRLIVGSALLSMALGAAAATLSPGRSMYSPSNVWALRDPAGALAVFSAACAAGVLRRAGTRRASAGLAAAALVLAGLQGPAYATSLVVREFPDLESHRPWTHDMTAPGARVFRRGLPPGHVPLGARLALWPGVRGEMRNRKYASTDFADAGYLLVTAWTKQRTMRSLVEPNEVMFDQSIELSPEVLCDTHAVGFLQLRYLLLPRDVECAPWTRMPDLRVDGWLDVGVAKERDERVRALPTAQLTEPAVHDRALSARAALLRALVPLPGSAVIIDPPQVAVRLGDPSVARSQALVLPVFYDPAWRASSGDVYDVGGLVALVGVYEPQVTLEFVPDLVAILRALSMTLAQALTVVGLLGLAYLRPGGHA